MKQQKQRKKELSLTKIYIIIFIAIFVISIIALIIDSIYKANLTNQDLPITKSNLIPYTFGTIIFIWLIDIWPNLSIQLKLCKIRWLII
ncbi:hypothetical protein [Mycoplasma crocodyli]|uniref:hypothetical protein n=1 Tax=Mycoplasma crocodyli TaxID=50052 RepID=UPI0005A18EBC|nr:hypothetical protein [Mycoplasma crocodyli]